MQTERFDLNDIRHEPSDAQLDALMQAVADEAARRAAHAREEWLKRLRADIAAANRPAVA